MSLADDLQEEYENLASTRDSWRGLCLDVLETTLEEGAAGGILPVCQGILRQLRQERIAPPLPARPEIHVAVFERTADQPLPPRVEPPAIEAPVALEHPEVAETPPTAPDKPVGVFEPIHITTPPAPKPRTCVCKTCGDSFQVEVQGNHRYCPGCKEKKGQKPAPPPRTSPRVKAPAPAEQPAKASVFAIVSNGHAANPHDQAINQYRAHLASGNPPSNTFEAELMTDFRLNRTEVMKMREVVLKERHGITTVKCQECRTPFDILPGHKGSRVVCSECRGVAKAVDQELATT